MNNIEPELNSDISGIPDRRYRLIIRMLVIAVIGLVSALGLLWYKLDAKQGRSENDEKERIRTLESNNQKKDSALIECLQQQTYNVHQRLEEQRLHNVENIAASKRQDSLLALLNRVNIK